MGVFKLESFMEGQSLMSKENIGTSAKIFRESKNKTPILLIDFPSCFGHIYKHASIDKICGGQIKEFVDVFKQLLYNFEKNGIQCVFFCDGYPPKEKWNVWLQRRKGKIQTANATIYAIEAAKNVVEFKKLQDDFNKCSLPATGAWFSAMNYLRSVNSQFIQTVCEADHEIISYFRQQGCFGVLAQDSDFVIAEGILHYFSVKHLNIHTLETMEYRRDKLIDKIHLRTDLLPIFATLCGNDVVDISKLRDFHRNLCETRQTNHRNQVANNSPHILFPKIAEWINVPSRCANLKRNPGKVAEMIGQPGLSYRFKASVESYQPTAHTSTPHGLTGNRNWDAVVEKTNSKMRHQYQSSKIHSVIVSQVLFCSIYLQYFANKMYPSDEKVASTIRRKFYGILLKEHPTGSSLTVTEFVSSVGERSQSVGPIFPENHPGLLSIWSDRGNLEEKWKLLCWAVGDGVPLKQVRALPEPLQIPTLALFYITHESKNLLQTWQAAALALQAVRLLRATPSELHDLQCSCQDAVAVHLGTVYQSLCMWVSYVAEACGNPTCLFKFGDFAIFDGKLFHSIYLSFKRNGNFRGYLGTLNTQEAEIFKQMQVVINR